MSPSLPNQELLQELDKALEEFFSPSTTNDRKHAIETGLEGFKRDSSCLGICLQAMLDSGRHQPRLLMFVLHCLQETVEKRWVALGPQEKAEVRGTCVRCVSVWFTRSLPPFLLSKLVHIIASIARLDWPQPFAEFPQLLLQWLSNPETVRLGLGLVKNAAEEFGSGRCLLLSPRQGAAQKLRFQTLLLPQIIPALQAILDAVVKEQLLKSTGEVWDLWLSLRSRLHSLPTPCLPSHVSSVGVDVLDCILSLLESGTLNTDSLIGPNNTAGVLPCLFCLGSYSVPETAWRAVETLIELTSGRLAPEMGQQLSQHLYEFIRIVLRELLRCTDCFDPSIEPYWQKLLELLKSFFHSRFHLLEKQWSQLHLDSFLVDLCFLTERAPSPWLFLCCLDAWQTLWDLVLTKGWSLSNYEPAMEHLTRILIQKLVPEPDSWHSDACLRHFELPDVAISALLQERNEEHHDDAEDQGDWETWSAWMGRGAEAVGKLAELSPMPVFRLLEAALQRRLPALTLLTQTSAKRDLDWSLAGVQSSLTLLSRLSHCFTNEAFWKHFPQAKALVEKLCEAVVFCSGIRRHENLRRLGLEDQLDELLAGFLLCLRSFGHWLAQFYAEAQRTGDENQTVSAILTASLDVSLPLLPDSSPSLASASVSLVFSILTTVRPHSYVLSMRSVNMAYTSACERLSEFRHRLTPSTFRVLYSSLANYLILPWFQAVEEDQEWIDRKRLYKRVMDAVTKDIKLFFQADSVFVLQRDASMLDWSVPLLVEMTESISNESSKTKQLALGALWPVAEGTLASLQRRGLEQLLHLLHSLFTSLCVQLGPEFTQKTVVALLELSRRESGMSGRAMERLLGILEAISREMSSKFSQFTEGVLALLLDNLSPLLLGEAAQKNPCCTVDSRWAFFSLLFSVLDARWRHFFPVGIGSSTKENRPPWIADESPAADPGKLLLLRSEQFVAVCGVFGECLESESEPSILKQNLAYMNLLHRKWGLYRKPTFQRRLLNGFCLAILRSLLTDRFPLLAEDLTESLCLMICGSEESQIGPFLETILPEFLTGSVGADEAKSLVAKFPMASDQPSFSAEIRDLIAETRIFQISRFHSHIL